MIPTRPASLFRSRWAALLYAGGVLWFALDVAGTKPDTAGQATANASSPASDDAAVKALEAQVHELENVH